MMRPLCSQEIRDNLAAGKPQPYEEAADICNSSSELSFQQNPSASPCTTKSYLRG